MHSNIGNSTLGSRAFSLGRHHKLKVPTALKNGLRLVAASVVICSFVCILKSYLNNRSNIVYITSEIVTKKDKTNTYLLNNIEYHYAKGQYGPAKTDLELLLTEQPNNKRARYIQLHIAYSQASNAPSAEPYASYLTKEYNLRYPLDTLTVPYMASLYNFSSNVKSPTISQ